MHWHLTPVYDTGRLLFSRAVLKNQ
jgi:hypothetical protein